MFKTLFGEKYSKAFLDRVEWRKKEYYEKRRIQTIRSNAAKMAMNWTHEYPAGTPLEYIRDDIIECWEGPDDEPRNCRMNSMENIQKQRHHSDESHYDTVTPTKKYAHEWRNPPDEGNND